LEEGHELAAKTLVGKALALLRKHGRTLSSLLNLREYGRLGKEYKLNERVQPANFFPNERMLAISNDIENAPASANPVAFYGVSERITIK